MVLFQAQVILAADSSIPADVAINSYHFQIYPQGQFLAIPEISIEQLITGERELDIDENGIHGDLCDFYVSIGEFLSIDINAAASRIKWYNLEEPEPRVPLLELPMKPFVTANSSLPAEIAIVSSFEALPLNGVRQSTRRNRVYLGPLSQEVVGFSNNAARVPAAVQTAITDAASNLALNSFDQPRWTWVVYSPTTGASTPVQRGWVDDAWDSQRRRGIEASTRTNWVQDAEPGEPEEGQE
uniref:Uncharacterized protein n=1 Tax=uncultured prokaryote TaxID=198431 RepID=A0A0H5Q3E3_9ZZZZ|nr:hypothetical protein [uncultured prokaryote]